MYKGRKYGYNPDSKERGIKNVPYVPAMHPCRMAGCGCKQYLQPFMRRA